MSKHTPTPWEADRLFVDSFSYRSGHTTVADDYMTVFIGDAAVNSALDQEHDFAHVHGPAQEANARLIAAAPDLLALVIQYRDDLRRPPSPETVDRRLAAIVAVLEKLEAEG